MKKHLLIFAFLFVALLTRAQVNVTSTGGFVMFNSYTTLKAAFDSINGGYQSGDLRIDITGNTTETASARLDSSGKINSWGTSYYTSLRIRPSGGSWTISGAITAGSPLIDLNGADSVTIDGTDHFTGDSLTIVNTTASATSNTCTIRLTNDASQNVLKNLVIKGAPTMSTTTNGGVIYIATAATNGSGNDNNVIRNCVIANSNATNTNFPYKHIYLNGTTTNANIANSGNIIDGNSFINFRANGVYSNTGVKDLTISNNHFYHTATLPSSAVVFAPIWVSNSTASIGENFTLSGNYIGGSLPFCGGTQSVIALSAVFQVIYLHSATSATSYISNNKIANMDISSSSSTANHSYIFMNGGKIMCGTMGGNTIGSMTDTANLIFRYNNSSQTNFTVIAGAGATTSPVFDTVWIENNIIGGITHRQVSTAGASLRVFDPTGSTATFMIRRNTVGSPSVPHSIKFYGTGNNMFGLLNRASGPNIHYFVGNVYSNLSNICTGTGSSITGFDGGGAWIVDSNTFQYLTGTTPNPSIASAAVTGIRFKPSASSNSSLNANIVRNLYATHATVATAVIGLDLGGTPAATINTVAGNKIYNLGASTTGIATIIGMRMTCAPTQTIKVYNNLISLGKDSLDNDITKGYTFFGAQRTRGNIGFFHNSILISGMNADTSYTYAFYTVDTGGTYSVINNVFSNERSHTAFFAPRNYAAQYNGTITSGAITGTTDINFNLYNAPNMAGVLINNSGTEYLTLPSWRSVAFTYDLNSVSGSPSFVSSTQLRGGPGSAITFGNNSLGITNDIDNATRNHFLIGAYDNDFLHPVPVTYVTFTGTAEATNVILTWTTASELNNRGFEIERSADGELFETVSFVKGHGTSTSANTYSYTDVNILDKQTLVYYRLKQIDFDGTSAYSKKIVVSTDMKHSLSYAVQPNPFAYSFNLTIDANTSSEVSLELIDITGRTVLAKTVSVQAGNNTITIDNLDALKQGLYFARLKMNGEVHVSRLIKN
jgi:hypothetical protein